MNHHAMTQMILYINGLLDTGKYDGITVDEVMQHIERGDILQWLPTRCVEFPASLFGEHSPYTGFEDFWVNKLQSLQNASGLGKHLVQNRGLCLLIAWTNEILQMGTGWKP